MKLTKITSVVVALAFAALLGTSARAQNAGDVFLGIWNSSGSYVYEVDLGSAGQFLDPSSPTETFTLSSSDLTTYLGSGWATSTTTQWGLIGASNASGDLTLGSSTVPANTLFVTWNTWATPPSEGSPNGLQNAQNDYTQFVNGWFNGGVPQSGNLAASYLAKGTSTGFDTFSGSGVNFDLPSGAGFNDSIVDYTSTGGISAPDSVTLDLYELTETNADAPKSTSLLGTLSLSNAGVLTFTEAPEPSTYLLMGLGGLVLVWRLRRNASLVA